MGAEGLTLAQDEDMAAGTVGAVDNTAVLELDAQCVHEAAEHEAMALSPFGRLELRE
jgi:hypothetical protein